ncbi:cache domain-containing protein [Acetobacter sp.]|uniref:cache domain-containing protein n=1 Tax=Acetobacter sp. TaxID=440 RepID=UPI0025BB7E1B|nr:cache domain-containing protein [Acetobacter sp.]MCH4090437.1 histidine kinase [Acetobacter sp.]MCI1299131.1 histidine kinase [Acetobacter sp.]MCI1315678.1 histidine kinase [Acetobacter sp.]
MVANEIVDPTEQKDVSLRQKFIQVVVPVATVLLILLAIGGIGWHNYRTTRAGVLNLTHDLLESVQRYVVQDVTGYMGAATLGGSFAQDFIGHAPVTVTRGAFYSYGATMLRLVPQIQSYYMGDQNGGFLLVERGPDGKGLEYTELQVVNGKAIFHHDFYDEKSRKIRSEENTSDNYDPRIRPWYQNALEKKGFAWTPPTIYESTKQLVVTGSVPLVGQDGVQRVFAINVSLNELSDFLDALKISQNGTAIILDSNGRIIAGHGFQSVVERSQGDPARMTLDPVTQGTFKRVYDTYRVRGVGSHPFRYGGKNYIGMVQALPASDHWVLLIVAPENDFARFARQSGRESFKFSVIIIVLAGVLAGLLARQGRRTERVTRELRREKTLAGTQTSALQQIAVTPDLLNVNGEALALTEELARVTQSRKTSLWRLLHDGMGLICEDSFDSRQEAHSGGFDLARKDMEDFFKLVDSGAPVAVPMAAKDERTAPYERFVMRDSGTSSLMLYPIRGASGGHADIVGVITLEDAPDPLSVSYFLEIVASITAIRFAGMAELPEPDKAAETDSSEVQKLPAPRFDAALMQTTKACGEVGQGQFPSVAVMVVTFSDPVMENGSDGSALLPLIDRIASEVQEIARRYSLFSVKVAGHRLICVAGCTKEADSTAIWRMAEAALVLRETCMLLLSSANIEPIFSIGMDYGPAMGGELGAEPRTFNLWGEAVTLAELMAQGAPDVGTIEVTERVYQALREHYLFHSRGSFYAPSAGIGRVYVLATRR